MDLQKLEDWAKKVANLQIKYFQEKHHLVSEMKHHTGKALFRKRDESKLAKNREELTPLIQNKQIPLYRNIYNYAEIARGIISKSKNDEKNKLDTELNVLREQARQIIRLLELQAQEKSEENLFKLFDQENKLHNDFHKTGVKMSKLSRKASKIVLKLGAELLDKGSRVGVYAQNHREQILWAQRVVTCATCIAMVAGVAVPEEYWKVRRIFNAVVDTTVGGGIF